MKDKYDLAFTPRSWKIACDSDDYGRIYYQEANCSGDEYLNKYMIPKRDDECEVIE